MGQISLIWPPKSPAPAAHPRPPDDGRRDVVTKNESQLLPQNLIENFFDAIVTKRPEILDAAKVILGLLSDEF